LVLPALLVAFASVECAGEVVDQTRAEQEIQTELQRVLNIEARSADCPSDVSAESQERFRCQIDVLDGDPLVAEIKVLNNQADLQIIGVTGG
jgi:hypothetical protein